MVIFTFKPLNPDYALPPPKDRQVRTNSPAACSPCATQISRADDLQVSFLCMGIMDEGLGVTLWRLNFCKHSKSNLPKPFFVQVGALFLQTSWICDKCRRLTFARWLLSRKADELCATYSRWLKNPHMLFKTHVRHILDNIRAEIFTNII